MKRDSKEVHHLHYKDSLGVIAGRETPGIDVVAVCKRCHRNVCHSKENWVIYKENPEVNNHNTKKFKREILSRALLLNRGIER